MEKLFVVLMILLFAVGLTSQTIFNSDGIQNDAVDMKTSTQDIVQEANEQMNSFSSSGGTGTGN